MGLAINAKPGDAVFADLRGCYISHIVSVGEKLLCSIYFIEMRPERPSDGCGKAGIKEIYVVWISCCS